MAYHNTLENLEVRHHRADDRAIAKAERLEPKALELVGELCREGKTVYYINIKNSAGRNTGKTKESANRWDLVEYLIRNKYVA